MSPFSGKVRCRCFFLILYLFLYKHIFGSRSKEFPTHKPAFSARDAPIYEVKGDIRRGKNTL